MIFSDLGLSEDLLNAVTDAGYIITPIQAGRFLCPDGARYPRLCPNGYWKNRLVHIAHDRHLGARPSEHAEVGILEPTRELAAQVAENFDIYGRITA